MSDHIPFVDLGAQMRSLGPELKAAVVAVLESGHFVLGEPVEAFERGFAARCGVGHAVAVNSGTSALHLALLAADIGPGDEVITVPMTFAATVAAIEYAGAMPRLVDIDPARGTMDPRALAAAITPRTRAIIPVHLHGRMADMAPILAIARPRDIVVIEDAAQAHGARYHGRAAGAHGALGCFSFYPAKNLGACGEGGAVVTDDPTLARRLRVLRDWGQEEKYIHALRGFNYRMDAIQGAILGVKLPHLEAWTRARRALARQYDQRLHDQRLHDQRLREIALNAPQAGPPGEHVYHVYAIRSPERDRLRSDLAAHGVGTGVHYPVPVHLQPAYADLGYRKGDFPASEAFAAETMSLPMFPELTVSQVDRVCDVLERVVRGAHVAAA